MEGKRNWGDRGKGLKKACWRGQFGSGQEENKTWKRLRKYTFQKEEEVTAQVFSVRNETIRGRKYDAGGQK